MRDATPSNLTDCGLPGIRSIPYGVHMCHFYRGREELAAVLMPYFAAGLQEARALADGYAGLRITGNVTFLTPETWLVFMEYEDLLTKAFSGRRIVTLCTYPSDGCGASNVLDVVHRHSCTLEHPDEGWQILTRIPA